MKAGLIGLTVALACAQSASAGSSSAPSQYDAIIAKHAAATGVPETLIRRIIVRESRYNPAARHAGHYGMMQIKPATAQSMGYQGGAAGLLDADTNLTYGVRYLAGAYKVAGGNHDRAVRLYASGYYYDAKRKGLLADVGLGRNAKPFAAVPATPTVAVAAAPAAQTVKIETRVAAAAPTQPAAAVSRQSVTPSAVAQAAAPRAVAAAGPRVISPSAAPALASSLPTLSPADKPSAPASRIATAAAAVGGLQRVASAETASPDPKASAYSGGRQPASTPFAGVSAPRAAAVPTPPLPPVARATPPAAAPALSAVASPVQVARPIVPTALVSAAVPTPPARDPMLATGATEPRKSPQIVKSSFPRSR